MHELLNELWELSGKGEAEWWPDGVTVDADGDACERLDTYWFLRWARLYLRLSDRVALDRVVAEAERWLVGKGWNMQEPGCTHQREYENEPQGTGYLSLTEAIKHTTKGA